MTYLVVSKFDPYYIVAPKDFDSLHDAKQYATEQAMRCETVFYIVHVEAKIESKTKIEVSSDNYFRDPIFPAPTKINIQNPIE